MLVIAGLGRGWASAAAREALFCAWRCFAVIVQIAHWSVPGCVVGVLPSIDDT
jgi:hypothetical protein